MNSIKRTVSLKKAIIIYISVALFLMFEMAVQVSPSVMAVRLMRDLSIGAFGLGLMSSVYFYTYTAMQLPSGLLFDRFRARVIIPCSIIVCSLGAVLFGLADGFVMACLGRLLMGFGSAFAFVSVLVVASDLFDAKYFSLIVGITQMLAAIGAMGGQLPINFLVNHVDWHITMFLLAGFGFVLAFVVWSLLNYPQTLSCLCSQAQTSWFGSVRRDLGVVVRNKYSWFVALYACLLWAPMSGFASLWGVPFLLHFDHLSSSHAALASSMMWLGLAAGSPLLGLFNTLINNRIIGLWISALLGLLAFFFVVTMHLPYAGLLAALFLAGVACAGQALSFAVVKMNNPDSIKSTAIAFNNMAVVISGALFQPIVGRLIEHYHPLGAATAYQRGCYLILAAYVIGFIVAILFVRERRPA